MSQPIALENLSWRQEAERALETEAATGRVFDAYDLQERHGLTAPANANEWGPLFQWAAQKGLIRSVGFHQSRRPSRSGGVCRVWTGTHPKENSGPGSQRQSNSRTAPASNTKKE